MKIELNTVTCQNIDLGEQMNGKKEEKQKGVKKLCK